MKKLYLVSLGCPKNLVDSELMLGSLQKSGFNVCQDPAEATIILVNTCGFIQSAVEEAIDEILQLIEFKKNDPEKLIVVTGCLVQRYGDSLKAELPEVDLFIGTDGFIDIAARVEVLLGQRVSAEVLLGQPVFLMNSTNERTLSTPAHRAYLKITEGCSNRCSYCMIPSIRGKLRSRELDDIILEAQRLESQGVKELTLVGQDLTAYGIDLRGPKVDLPALLQALLRETGIPWIRTLYLYPHRIKDSHLELVAANPRLLPYFDIPLQHVSDSILRLMNRPYGYNKIEELFARIATILPKAAIRTTFIVGFPGETPADVDMLEKFMRLYRLNHVGIFPYSNEDGCDAAKLPNHCSDFEKEERMARLMAVQAEISQEINAGFVGTVESVLVEGLSSETDLLMEGRTRLQAPDIDGCVYINDGSCTAGDIVKIKFTEAHTYDLVGEVV
nr:30S ribosomal protein S12 methylthiotransferase RimO [Desulfobulbaceae bacterium]